MRARPDRVIGFAKLPVVFSRKTQHPRVAMTKKEDRSMLKRILASGAIGLGLAGSVLAGDEPNKKVLPGPIKSISDVQDTAKLLFKLADTNNDGQISQQEAVDAGNLLVGGFFFRADTNGDGVLSADERGKRASHFSHSNLCSSLSSSASKRRTPRGEAMCRRPTCKAPPREPTAATPDTPCRTWRPTR